MMSKFLQGLKLQLFNDGGVPQPQPQPTPTPQPQEQPPQAQPQQPPIDINSLVNNLSARIDQTLNQRLAPIEQRMNQPTQEQIEEQNEQIRQQFESNPIEFVRRIQEEAKQQALNEIKEQYDPLIQQTQSLNNRLSWQDNVRNFMSANPEAQKYLPQIVQVIQENPGLVNTQDPLGIAYKTVISNSLLGNGGNLVEGILSNEDLKNQLLQNEAIKQQIIQEYQQGLNNGTGKELPPLMGNNQTGTQIPASTGELPKNMKEAKLSAIRRLQMLNQQ
jgi:hypothetical protein